MELSNSFGVKETFINRIFWGLESTLPPNLFVVKIYFHTLLLIDSIWFTTWYGPRFVITVTKTCSFGSKGIPPKHGHPNMFEIGCNWVKYDQLYSSLLNIYIYTCICIYVIICIYIPLKFSIVHLKHLLVGSLLSKTGRFVFRGGCC